jgi:hypothetical protein
VLHHSFAGHRRRRCSWTQRARGLGRVGAAVLICLVEI